MEMLHPPILCQMYKRLYIYRLYIILEMGRLAASCSIGNRPLHATSRASCLLCTLYVPCSVGATLGDAEVVLQVSSTLLVYSCMPIMCACACVCVVPHGMAVIAPSRPVQVGRQDTSPAFSILTCAAVSRQEGSHLDAFAPCARGLLS